MSKPTPRMFSRGERFSLFSRLARSHHSASDFHTSQPPPMRAARIRTRILIRRMGQGAGDRGQGLRRISSDGYVERIETDRTADEETSDSFSVREILRGKEEI